MKSAVWLPLSFRGPTRSQDVFNFAALSLKRVTSLDSEAVRVLPVPTYRQCFMVRFRWVILSPGPPCIGFSSGILYMLRALYPSQSMSARLPGFLGRGAHTARPLPGAVTGPLVQEPPVMKKTGFQGSAHFCRTRHDSKT